MSRRAWIIWGAMMALIISIILLTNNQMRSDAPQLAMGTSADSSSKNEESNTVKAPPNVDLNLLTAKNPYETLFRTTDNVGKTVLIKLRVDDIREITSSNSKFTVIRGWPAKDNDAKANKGKSEYVTGSSGMVALITKGSAWSSVSKNDDIEVVGIIAYISDYDGHYTPSMKKLPEKTIAEMNAATTNAKNVFSFTAGAVILVPTEKDANTANVDEKAVVKINPAEEINNTLNHSTLPYLELARYSCLKVIDLIPDATVGAVPVSSFVNQICKTETDIQEIRRYVNRDFNTLKGELGKEYPKELEEISSLADRAINGYADGLRKMREATAWRSPEAWDEALKEFEHAADLYSKTGKLIESYNSSKKSSI